MKRRPTVPAAVLVGLLLLVLGAPAGLLAGAAPTPGTVHFTAVGDFGSGANTAAVLDSIRASGSDLTLTLGDLSYGTVGAEQAWCDFVTARVGAGYPFELLAGNHESNGQNGNINDFSACLPNQLPGLVGTYGRQYYVDVPAADPLVRFIQISPALAFPDGPYTYPAGSPRYAWTEAAIDGARAAGVPWVVVGMHKPCLSVGVYSCEPGTDLMNLLLAKKVDLVLSGHEHSYMRSHQIGLAAGCPSLTPNVYDPDCVADADSTYASGAGSVLAVVGTGGVGLREVSSTDPEAPYFAATSGLNADPTWGTLDVRATATDLRASFLRASGGTLSDGFVITRGAPPAPNEPPTAAFSTTCTATDCSFDGSGSADPDGTVASSRWDFGDGTPVGSGTTTTHRYAAAGAYPVRLTVTDDDGASSSTTRTVTVTAPPTPPALVADDFARTVATGLGSAPTGGPYTYSGSSSLFSVSGGAGAIRTAAGSGPAAYLAGLSTAQADLRLAFRLDRQPTGNGLYLSTLVRRTTAGSYVAKARVSATGAVSVELTRKPASGSEVPLAAPVAVPGLTHAVGDTLLLRLQADGVSPTTLRARVWKAGTAEPATWLRTATDDTAGGQGPGSIGVSPYLSGGATNGPVTVLLDDLTVTTP